MGLFTRKFKQPVRGTATVASSTACPSHASSASCRMNLVIAIPGVPATPVEYTAMARADKWPYPGAVLPVEVDAAKASRMRILWDEVPSSRHRGEAAAAQMAAAMNAQAGTGAAAQTDAAATVGQFFAGAVPLAVGTSPAGTSPAGALPAGTLPAGALPVGFQIPPGARVVSSTVSINGVQAGAEQIAAIESLTGLDLDGDGVVGPPQA